MSEKAEFLNRLDDTRRDSLVALKNIDPATVIHPDSGWTVKDVIGHLADWEDYICKGVQAFAQGQVFIMPDTGAAAVEEDFETLNEVLRGQHLHQSAEQVFAYWADIRQQFRHVLDAIPDENMHKPYPIPWYEAANIDTVGMVISAIDHEAEHLDDILSRL